MTQLLQDDGTVVPVTVIQAGPCVVVQKKTKQKDGYEAVQLGFVEFVKPKRVNKPMTGTLRKPMSRRRDSCGKLGFRATKQRIPATK